MAFLPTMMTFQSYFCKRTFLQIFLRFSSNFSLFHPSMNFVTIPLNFFKFCPKLFKSLCDSKSKIILEDDIRFMLLAKMINSRLIHLIIKQCLNIEISKIQICKHTDEHDLI